MKRIFDNNDKMQFAIGQNSRDLRVSPKAVIDLPQANTAGTHLMDAIDNVSDFFRFVDRSSKSEVSSRDFTRPPFMKLRSSNPRHNYYREKNALQRPILRLLYGRAVKPTEILKIAINQLRVLQIWNAAFRNDRMRISRLSARS
jgi:hypothetical protein